MRALGRGRYEALGRLSLRGREREVKIRFGFRQVEALGVFEGGFDLRRLDYGIGEAVWGDTGVVADVVRIPLPPGRRGGESTAFPKRDARPRLARRRRFRRQ